jgi:hypothetical protein
MSIAVTPLDTPAPATDARRRAIVALGRAEARRNLRSPWLLVVAAYTLFTSVRVQPFDWAGGTYSLLALQVVPFAALASFQGLRVAGRDRQADLPPLAEEAPLGEEERVLGRLVGLGAYVAIAAAAVLVAEVVGRLEGGYWMGEGLNRTESAQHTPVEWLVPPVAVAAAASAGLALGRRFQLRLVVGIAAGVFWFLLWGAWWAFQFTPMVTVALVPIQPMTIDAGPGDLGFADFPEDWWVLPPDEYNDRWTRQVVSQPFVAAHVVYLVGLTVLFTSVALRLRGAGVAGARGPLATKLRRIGWATVVVGMVLQLWVLDWGLTPGGTGLNQMP